jgi:hypothetical protein
MTTYKTGGIADAGLAIIVGIIVGLIAAAVLPVQNRTQPASAAQDAPFDHSLCQYPERTTNLPDGCDNSDPCDPASAAKGGSGDCSPAAVEPVTTTPATTKPTSNACEVE